MALATAARRLPQLAGSSRAVVVAATRHYGALSDEDRIFQNLYGRHDWGLKAAMKRVRCNMVEYNSSTQQGG